MGIKKILAVYALSFLMPLITGCAKYTLLNQKDIIYPPFEQKKIEISISKFVDDRPEEEKKGLTKRTRKILSFATKDNDFKEKINEAVTQRVKFKLEESGFYADILANNNFGDKRYILEGEIKHFQVTMRLPNTTFVPYLGTAATLITKDEFNVAISIKAIFKDAKSDKILFSQLFDASENVNVPTGPLNINRFARGISYRFKLLDSALNNVAELIVQKITAVLSQENAT